MTKKLILLAGCLATLAGCYKDTEEELYPDWSETNNTPGCDTANVGYAAVIQPIFTQNCTQSGCHDAATRSNGYDLTNYQGAKAAVSAARLLGVIRHEPGFSAMPKGGNKLSDCNISKITAWVNKGAPNN